MSRMTDTEAQLLAPGAPFELQDETVPGADHAELGQAVGQEVRAVLVMEPGAPFDDEKRRAWVAETLAYDKVPTLWERRADPRPRNATGKVLENALDKSADSMFIEE